MEIVILALLALWLFLAIRSIKKGHGCCGKCSGCKENGDSCKNCKK